MNNDYLTPKQLLSIMLAVIMTWIPPMYQMTSVEQLATDIEVVQSYRDTEFEPVVYLEEALEETEPIPEPVEEPLYSLTEEEIDLLALVTMAEAEGEPEEGKRLVIDTILNRVDSTKFPDTVYDVIYQPKAFTSMWTSRVKRCHVRDDIRQLVIEELESRTNDEVIFFRTDHYHSYGTPVFQVGNHYFSKY